MKRTVMLLALSLLVACGGKTETASNPKDTATTGNTTTAKKMFEVKSGIIEMKNSMVDGMRQTMYFDDYGAKQATVTSVEMMGKKHESVQIMADGWNLTYDPAAKTGTKMKLPPSAIGNGSPVPSPADLSDELKAKYNYKELGEREIVGKTAKGYSMNAMGTNVKAWTWNNMPLYLEMTGSTGPAIIMEATSIKTDVDIPADRFTVPSDVKMEEVSANTPIGGAPGQ